MTFDWDGERGKSLCNDQCEGCPTGDAILDLHERVKALEGDAVDMGYCHCPNCGWEGTQSEPVLPGHLYCEKCHEGVCLVNGRYPRNANER